MTYLLLAWSAVVAVTALLFVISEKRRGRLGKPPLPEATRAWFHGNVLPFPPEVAGAALEFFVGLPQVKAILVRMLLEKKIRSRIRRDSFGEQMELQLEVPIEALSSRWEESLVRALFVFGNRTNRERIIAHYRGDDLSEDPARYGLEPPPRPLHDEHRGFNATSAVSFELETAAERLVSGTWFKEHHEGAPQFRDLKPSWSAPLTEPLLWLYVGGAALAQLGDDVLDTVESPVPTLLYVSGGIHVIPRVMAEYIRRRSSIRLRDVATLVLMLSALPLTALAFDFAWGPLSIEGLAYAGFLYCLSVISVFRGAHSDSERSENLERERLAHGKEFLAAQLVAYPQSFPDEWLPYVFAFGLEEKIDPVTGEHEDFQQAGGAAKWGQLLGKLVEPWWPRESGESS